MRDILEDLFGNAAARSDRGGAAQHAPATCASASIEHAGVGEATPFPILLDARAVQDAGGRRAGGCRRVRSRDAIAAEWERARRAHRSRHHAADAARQHDHRRRRDRARSRSPRRSPNISARIWSAIAPTRPKGWCARRRGTGIRSSTWARETLGARFMLSEGVVFVAQPERRGRGGARRDPVRSVAARRRQCHHHAHRLGADRARGRAWPARRRTRPGTPRMSTRTGTWSSGAATSSRSTPRRALRRHAGGRDGAGVGAVNCAENLH